MDNIKDEALEESTTSTTETSVSSQTQSFNWVRYLRGLGITIITLGCITTFILVLTIAKEFSLEGFIITISVFLASLIVHAILCWFAEMLKNTEAIRAHFIDKP